MNLCELCEFVHDVCIQKSTMPTAGNFSIFGARSSPREDEGMTFALQA